MTSRKKFKSRRKFLVGSSAAALVPTAIACAPLISVAPSFPRPKFGIGEEVSPCGDKEELHSSRLMKMDGGIFCVGCISLNRPGYWGKAMAIIGMNLKFGV